MEKQKKEPPAAGTLEALAQVIAQRVARRDGQRPKLRLVENPRPSTIDGVTRDSILRRIRWLRDHYNLACLIDQATFNTPGIDCLENDALARLHREMEAARECCMDGVPLDEAGFIRDISIQGA